MTVSPCCGHCFSDTSREGQDPGHAVLLLRRHRYTGTISSFLCWTPDPVPLAKLIKVAVIPEPRRDKPHRDAWALWRRRHQYGAQQAHQRWHAYADETPR